jgi:hypothetical protein
VTGGGLAHKVRGVFEKKMPGKPKEVALSLFLLPLFPLPLPFPPAQARPPTTFFLAQGPGADLLPRLCARGPTVSAPCTSQQRARSSYF